MANKKQSGARGGGGGEVDGCHEVTLSFLANLLQRLHNSMKYAFKEESTCFNPGRMQWRELRLKYKSRKER